MRVFGAPRRRATFLPGGRALHMTRDEQKRTLATSGLDSVKATVNGGGKVVRKPRAPASPIEEIPHDYLSDCHRRRLQEMRDCHRLPGEGTHRRLQRGSPRAEERRVRQGENRGEAPKIPTRGNVAAGHDRAFGQTHRSVLMRRFP